MKKEYQVGVGGGRMSQRIWCRHDGDFRSANCIALVFAQFSPQDSMRLKIKVAAV